MLRVFAYQLWQRLIGRFQLEQQGEQEQNTLFASILPVTNADDAVAEYVEIRKEFTPTGIQAITLISVPAGYKLTVYSVYANGDGVYTIDRLWAKRRYRVSETTLKYAGIDVTETPVHVLATPALDVCFGMDKLPGGIVLVEGDKLGVSTDSFTSANASYAYCLCKLEKLN